jgi:hypothetical protein
VHKRHSDRKGTDLEELITRNPGRPMWSLAQEIKISRNNCKKDGVRGLEIYILGSEERSIYVGGK